MPRDDGLRGVRAQALDRQDVGVADPTGLPPQSDVSGLVGELRSIGVWRADDETGLREKVLGTLPLWPWMTAEITALQSHPNDPGPTGGEDR
ncbi:hypothetical protein C3492_36115 [Streptomyces sp. Ru62]|nr:hypothetical protein C3492_36115 [Streptomyces sp. Ru62]